MINGAVERVTQLNDGSVLLNGWARHVSPDGARPVESFTFFGRDDVTISVTEREIDGVPGCGFRLLLPSAEELAALWWGGLSLHAQAGVEVRALRFWERIEESVLEIIMVHLAARLHGKADAAALRDAQQAKRDREEIRSFLDAAAAISDQEIVLLPRGATSQDSRVTVGRNGFLFLLGGSNGVMQQYGRPEDAPAVARWVALIRARQDYCAARNIGFIQMIVPEKQSAMPEFFPVPLATPTKLFAAITRELHPEPFFVDCGKLLRDLFVAGGLHPFRKVDSHLSYFGAEALVRELMRLAGLRDDIFAKTLREVPQAGDLGGKFFQGDMLEQHLVPAEDWEFARDAPDRIRADVPGEGHLGMVIEWRARHPISPQTLLIFGNSMFERGGSPLTLSWWLSRIFARTRFVWSASLLDEHVNDFRPSMVICQTVERFLPSLPER